MASDIWLRTILIVRKETRCRHIGYSFRLTARVLLYAPSHRQDSTYHSLCYTSRGALAGTRNSSMKDRSDDPSHHERTLLPRSYISLLLFGWHHLHKLLYTYEQRQTPARNYYLCNSRSVCIGQWTEHNVFYLTENDHVVAFVGYILWAVSTYHISMERRKGKIKECFILRRTQHILYTAIWRRTIQIAREETAAATWTTPSD